MTFYMNKDIDQRISWNTFQVMMARPCQVTRPCMRQWYLMAAYIDSFLSSNFSLFSELSSLQFGTFNPRRIGKKSGKRVILKTAYNRINMCLDKSSASLKTLRDRVSKSSGAWKLTNLNFSDKIHEQFQEICIQNRQKLLQMTIRITKLFCKLCPYEFSMVQILNQK